MELTETNRAKRVVEVIEPNTTRVLEMRRIREEQERIKAQQDEKERIIKEDEDRKKKNIEQLKLKERELEERDRVERERLRMEEEEESNTLTGKFGHMINDLNTHSTNLEFTISGLDLRPAQIKVLVNNVETNASLKALSMPRKGLTDAQGKEICEKLEKNTTLERLELEGNKFGEAMLSYLASLLKENDTIKFIDLEDNLLNEEKRDNNSKKYPELKEFVEALSFNDTVLCINLTNTGLDQHCSKMLRQVFNHNKTLILMDLDGNPNMALEDIVYIQDRLIENKQLHDDERYKEFIERKRMRREEDISGVLLLNQQTKKLRQEAIELNTEAKRKQLNNEWEEFLTKEEAMKLKLMAKYEKEAKMKGKKKKKKAAAPKK